MSDRQLLGSITRLRKTEKETLLSMLLHIIEVESRGLDLAGGYSSIFDFCVRALKYSESVANRRIRAARCIRRFPAVYEYLSSGKVNICNVSKISRIMKRENHIELLNTISGLSTREVDFLVSTHNPVTVIRDRIIPVKVMEKVIAGDGEDAPGLAKIPRTEDARSEGGKKFTASAGGRNSCTSGSGVVDREDDGRLVRSGHANKTEVQSRVEVKQKFKLQFAVSPGFMEKYEKVKELLSTKHPRGMDFECVFETCLDEYIERHSLEARQRRREERKARASRLSEKPDDKRTDRGGNGMGEGSKAEKEPVKLRKEPPKSHNRKALKGKLQDKAGKIEEPSRRIPARVRDEVFERDDGCCVFRGPDGRRCGSRWNLEIDHIVPFALGGSSDPDNLQLLCRRHNQHKAERDFGKGAVKKESTG